MWWLFLIYFWRNPFDGDHPDILLCVWYARNHMLSMELWPLTLLFPFCQAYFYNDDTFNFNYAQAKAALGNYEEAEEVWHLIWNIYFFGSFYGVFWAVIVFNYCNFFFFSISCWFRMKSSRMTTFISAGSHAAVCIQIFTCDQFIHLSQFPHMTFFCCISNADLNSYIFFFIVSWAPVKGWFRILAVVPCFQVDKFIILIGTKSRPLL